VARPKATRVSCAARCRLKWASRSPLILIEGELVLNKLITYARPPGRPRQEHHVYVLSGPRCQITVEGNAP